MSRYGVAQHIGALRLGFILFFASAKVFKILILYPYLLSPEHVSSDLMSINCAYIYDNSIAVNCRQL